MDSQIDLQIERLGVNGEGIGYKDGFTLFVDGALPGEIVRVEIYEKRKSFGRARLLERLVTSPYRVEPICPVFGRCGGCQLMHLEYTQQLEVKRQRVTDALQRIGKMFGVEAKPCKASPSPLGYRNKIQLPMVSGRLGLYARNTHDLVEVDHCFIHCDLGEKAFSLIRDILKTSSVKSDIRHVLIKTAVNTQQVLVIFVTAHEEFPKELAERLLREMPEIKGVVQNIQPVESNVILGRYFNTLAGQGWIEEHLSGLSFKVSPASFFQVNPMQAEKLYQQVVEFAALEGHETVLDAYCGVGTLSLILASRAKEVIGVECVKEAIADAKENAARNGILNARFTAAQAEEFIMGLKKVDVAVLNPPRKGCESTFLEKLVTLQPKRIVYVSCDPATLARDLALLCNRGYSLEEVQPFDMFPQTSHVECVAKLVL